MHINYDVIIIGGGPAGLNAAIVLKRCLLKVLIIDEGKQRNIKAQGIHNYLTCDNIPPHEFLQKAHAELNKYEIDVLKERVEDIVSKEGAFQIQTMNSDVLFARKILIATGARDIIPEIDGVEEYYGRSVFHCPYCDAWEYRGKSIGIYGKKVNGTGMSLLMSSWSTNLTLFTDGKKYFRRKQLDTLNDKNISVVTDRIHSLVGKDGYLEAIRLTNGELIPCEVLFFTNGIDQSCDLAKKLGCRSDKRGIILSDHLQRTNVPGVFIAGDIARDMQFVVIAAAEGAKAAVAIHQELMQEGI